MELLFKLSMFVLSALACVLLYAVFNLIEFCLDDRNESPDSTFKRR